MATTPPISVENGTQDKKLAPRTTFTAAKALLLPVAVAAVEHYGFGVPLRTAVFSGACAGIAYMSFNIAKMKRQIREMREETDRMIRSTFDDAIRDVKRRISDASPPASPKL